MSKTHLSILQATNTHTVGSPHLSLGAKFQNYRLHRGAKKPRKTARGEGPPRVQPTKMGADRFTWGFPKIVGTPIWMVYNLKPQ